MDYSVLIIFVVIVAAVGGFLVLMFTILNNWKAGSRGHEESDAFQSKRTKEYEQCYNQCMAAEKWEPDKSDRCENLCGASLGAHPNI
jgi:flagellar basal body-associated protein FliL